MKRTRPTKNKKQKKAMKRIALFAGSFDPFTRGHQALLMRALPMFDKIIVAIGTNAGKQCMLPVEERLKTIEEVFADEEKVEATAYTGLTMDFAREVGATVLLRGIRSVKDFEYEREIADINLKIGGIDTVLMMCEPEYASLSSSIVRELISYGKDVTPFLPQQKTK